MRQLLLYPSLDRWQQASLRAAGIRAGSRPRPAGRRGDPCSSPPTSSPRCAWVTWNSGLSPSRSCRLRHRRASRSGASPVPIAEDGGAPLEAPTGVQPELGIRADPEPDLAAPGSGGFVSGDVSGGFDTGVVIDTPPAPAVVTPVRAHTLLRPPVRLRDVAPVYPEIARTARVQGIVIVEAVISTTGNVIEARVLRSMPLLDQAAIDAVRQWKYTPSLLNGVPVPVVMTVTVTFMLK